MSIIIKSIQKKRGIRKYIGPKRIIILLIFFLTVILLWNSYQSGDISPEIIANYIQEYPFLSVLLYVLLYAFCVIATLPTLPFNLAAGFFWGGILGGFYTAVGVTLGGWISFLIARLLIGQPLRNKFDNNLVARFQNEFNKNGWKFVAFVRINPVFPTGPLNYLLGLTSLSSVDFLWVSIVFLLPPSIAIAYVGDMLQTFSVTEPAVKEVVATILGISAAVTFLVLLKYISKFLNSKNGNKSES